MRYLEKKHLQNIVLGAGLLGAGGGGSVKEGMKLVDKVLEYGPQVELISIDEIQDDSWGAVIAGMGSPKASLSRVRTNSPRVSLEALESAVGFVSSFVIPFELGAGNSLNPMLAAVQKKIPIVDGDPVGRAVPEIDMTTFSLGGVDISPLSLATEENITILIKTEKPADVERIARAITAELQGVSAISTQAMRGGRLKELIIPGTTTLVEKIGNLISDCRSRKEDPSTGLIEQFHGYLLGKGKVVKVEGETRGGFDFGVVTVKGEIPATIYFQNENMLAYNEKRLTAMVPDLICAIGSDGIPLTNADIEKGIDISYIGFKADDRFRTPEVCNLFRNILSALNYSGDFIPIESLN